MLARVRHSRQLTELEALYVVKEEEHRKDEWRRQLDRLGKAKTE